MVQANANPTKRFFIDMLTRDISLEDAILDLIDNCIDGYARVNNINLSSNLLTIDAEVTKSNIDIKINSKSFSITDNCGGIDITDARKTVFRFGREEAHGHSALSVYGIGLKRAIFKLGKEIEIVSRTVNNGFKLNINTDEWLKVADNNNWQFNLEEIDPASSISEAGTIITVTSLKHEIESKLKDNTVLNSIINYISDAYLLFLNNRISITVNNEKVKAKHISFAKSESLSVAKESWFEDDVFIEIICGLRPKDDVDKGFWKHENAGWYLVCNGRVVVTANKDELTGWGVKGDLPAFQPKFRGFTGIIFFSSDDNPEKLPWNTTKRGLNKESIIYLKARHKLISNSREVIRILDKVYKSNDSEIASESYKSMTNNIEEVDVAIEARDMRGDKTANKKEHFNFTPPSTDFEEKTTRVQYDVKDNDLKLVRLRLKKLSMSATAIGKHTFEYFIKRECD